MYLHLNLSNNIELIEFEEVLNPGIPLIAVVCAHVINKPSAQISMAQELPRQSV